MRTITRIHNLKLVLCIFLFILLLYAFVFQNDVFCFGCDLSKQSDIAVYRMRATESYHNVFNKRVTKSLSDIKRLTELNKHILVFNHGTKTGSEMFVLILKWLQGSNNFKHFRLKKDEPGTSSVKNQMAVTEFVSRAMKDLGTPVSFDSYSYFINFTSFGWDSPTYFGVIRDPGEILKASSKSEDYAGKMKENQTDESIVNINVSTDLNIPYFCGHNPRCTMINDDWALQKAKENAEKYYGAIGVIEYVDETLFVLENRLKYFFKSGTEIYRKKFTDKHALWMKKMKSNEYSLNPYKSILQREYDFYSWAKSRLFNQVDTYQSQRNKKEFLIKIPNVNFQIEEP